MTTYVPHGVTQVNGVVSSGESLVGSLDFFTVRTLVNINPTGNITDVSQTSLDNLVLTISLNAQPIIIGAVEITNETGPISDLPAAANGATVPVYNFNFAIEHQFAWGADGSDLELALNGVDAFVYSVGDTSHNNVSVVRYDVLS